MPLGNRLLDLKDRSATRFNFGVPSSDPSGPGASKYPCQDNAPNRCHGRFDMVLTQQQAKDIVLPDAKERFVGEIHRQRVESTLA